ncbi:MAG: hypothetical protein ACREFO_04565 [Acetobacteraceae bacterium]
MAGMLAQVQGKPQPIGGDETPAASWGAAIFYGGMIEALVDLS